MYSVTNIMEYIWLSSLIFFVPLAGHVVICGVEGFFAVESEIIDGRIPRWYVVGTFYAGIWVSWRTAKNLLRGRLIVFYFLSIFSKGRNGKYWKNRYDIFHRGIICYI